MRILLLGPECPAIESHLKARGHEVLRKEDAFDNVFLVTNGVQFGVSYRYKKIIKQSEIDWFDKRLVNLHISLLPWNRGADPNLWSYLEESPKGVTIHSIDAGIDTGDIILQKVVHMDINVETLRTSYNKLSREIEALFIDNCDAILRGALTGRKQEGPGSCHRSGDKQQHLHLIETRGWDTPVRELVGKAWVGAGDPKIAL